MSKLKNFRDKNFMSELARMSIGELTDLTVKMIHADYIFPQGDDLWKYKFIANEFDQRKQEKVLLGIIRDYSDSPTICFLSKAQ